jgi:hypothetical protein
MFTERVRPSRRTAQLSPVEELAWLAFGWVVEVVVDDELRERALRLGHELPSALPSG